MLFYHTGKALKTVLLLFLAVVLLTASAGYVHQSVPTQIQEKKKRITLNMSNSTFRILP